MNAGLQLGQLSACFVIPIDDSIEGIFDALKHMALIHQSGGGTGFSFSRLRPNGDVVHSTMGVASGPVSFMRIFDTATDVVKQGGRRRGANMGILNVNHPDIIEFITAKNKEGFLSNFNLSVAVTDDFMRAVQGDGKFPLINPRNGEKEDELSAKHVFDLITTSAWGTGDPGMVFLDEINRRNPTPQIGEINGTNPCGEVPLLDYESCNLGSINLSLMVDEHKKDVDWDKLRKTVRTAVHFLDNIIDANKYPLPEVKKITLANRKIGLGVMGFAELLIKLGVPYESEQAIDVAEKIVQFVAEEAQKKSSELGRERGDFPNFKGSIWEKKGFTTMRNATVTTIAPTGTISVIAGCSSGIEPLFAISFIRNVLGGTELLEVNPLFEEVARRRGFYSKELMNRIAKTGSIQDIDEIPKDVKKLFLTAFDITPAWHVKIQAAFQKYTDNAVSKTVNLPPDAPPEIVKEIYWLACKLKCKGITVYRYGSKEDQVLNIGRVKGKWRPGVSMEYVNVDSEFSGGCPTTGVCSI
jgi:ribonucleoside-diphosphate reductase alpha chain